MGSTLSIPHPSLLLTSSSPLRSYDDSSALAKAQAGDYDVEATKAELQEIIDGSKVVMFSFTT